MPKVTIVTGLWDIGRGGLEEGWSRSFAHYLECFAKLLGALRQNVIVFGDAELRAFVFEHRRPEATLFVERPLSWFRNESFDEAQAIRLSESWRAQAGWLASSTQGSLEYYAPLVLAKPFLLNDARLMDPFGSTHLLWLDAGLTNTVPPSLLSDAAVYEAVGSFDVMTFAAFPYAAEREVHGFDYVEMCRLANGPVTEVCRGGVFGGPVAAVTTFNKRYYTLLRDTLSRGFMGTEESLFSIIAHRSPEDHQRIAIGSNGLVAPFFERLRDDDFERTRVALYVLTFNSPQQLEALYASFAACDPDFLDAPDLIVINNSTEASHAEAYLGLCERYGATQLSFDNIGINGGRQYVAEHADEAGYDFYLFFEDDMQLMSQRGEPCRNGFARYVPALYRTALAIAKRGHFDFLKLSFTEFYGDNHGQWAWYNVPDAFRYQHWPELAATGRAIAPEELPRTRFEQIESYRGVAYAAGEVYYCNWPQIVSRAGNQQMFLKQRWAHPYEQTWMSHFYQETVVGRLRAGVLLLSPVEHDRFDHYGEGLRREC